MKIQPAKCSSPSYPLSRRTFIRRISALGAGSLALVTTPGALLAEDTESSPSDIVRWPETGYHWYSVGRDSWASIAIHIKSTDKDLLDYFKAPDHSLQDEVERLLTKGDCQDLSDPNGRGAQAMKLLLEAHYLRQQRKDGIIQLVTVEAETCQVQLRHAGGF